MRSPQSKWKPGDVVAAPTGNMLRIDPVELKPSSMYKLMTGTIVPRPIAFISTSGADGSHNLAPFSFFNGVSSNPPCLVVAIAAGRQQGKQKDTLRNILETREFVVNSANEWLIEPLVHSAGEYPYGVSEIDESGLTVLPSERVGAPRIKEAAIQFECKLHETLQIGDGSPGSSTLVVGQIVLVHISEAAYDNGSVLLEQTQPIGRLGGRSYSRVTETFELTVPRVDS